MKVAVLISPTRFCFFLAALLLACFVYAAPPPECATSNLIQDPGFDQPLETTWSTFGYPEPGALTLVSGELRVENTVSGDIGVDQTLRLDEFGGSMTGGGYEFTVWNRLKVDSYTTGGLVSVDLHFRYTDDSLDVLISTLDFDEGVDPLGVWLEKSATFLLPRGKVLDRINVYALSYYQNALGWFDDICVFATEVETYVWELNDFEIRLLESSSKVEDVEGVYYGASFVEMIVAATGEECESVAVVASVSEEDVYEFTFESGGPCESSIVRVKITSGLTKDYIVAELVEAENVGLISRIYFARFDLDEFKEDTAWATSPNSDGKIFGSAVALDENVVCRSWNWLHCRVEAGLSIDGMQTGRAAFVFAEKSKFAEALDRMIQAEGMPRMLVGSHQIPLKSGPLRENYLFAYVTHENSDELLSYTQRAGFPVFLMIEPLDPGSDNRPREFTDLEEFATDMQRFTDAGIGLGIHHFWCRVDPQDSLFSVSNLFRFPVGTLTGAIGIAATTATSSINIENDPDYDYLLQHVAHTKTTVMFSLDDELIECSTVSASSISGCSRGVEGTTAAVHVLGTQLYHIPGVSGDLMLDAANSAVISSSAAAFAAVANHPRLKIKYIFADGNVHIAPRDSSRDGGLMYSHRLCMQPYLDAMQHLEYVEYAEGEASYDFFAVNRYTSWDGVVFKNKLFTKRFKVPRVLSRSPYSIVSQYFGWWKIHGSSLGSGVNDFDSTTLDDVQYVMSKVFLTETSIGVELMSQWQKHSRMDDLLDLISQYHELIAEDVSDDVVSLEFKQMYKQPEKELELLPDYNFVEKKTIWEYVSWDGSAGQSNSFTLNNPFKKQPLKLEIRARPSYVGFDSPANVVLTDFASAGSWSTSVNDGDVTCSISDGGVLTFQNDRESDVGGCRISVPISAVDLTFKRGFGLDISGDSSDIVILIHAYYPTQFGMRDFRIDVDFSGRRQFLLGDATTELEFPVGETLKADSWDYYRNQLSWDFNWDQVLVSLYFFGVPGASSSSITLHSLKGLAETQGILVDPTISLNGGEDSFVVPGVLQFNDTVPYILEYDGEAGVVTLWDSNLKFLSSSSVASRGPSVDSGDVAVTIGSSSPLTSCDRADVRISLYGEVHVTSLGRGFWTWVNILWVSLVGVLVPCVVTILVIVIIVCVVCQCRTKKSSTSDVPLKEDEFSKRW